MLLKAYCNLQSGYEFFLNLHKLTSGNWYKRCTFSISNYFLNLFEQWNPRIYTPNSLNYVSKLYFVDASNQIYPTRKQKISIIIIGWVCEPSECCVPFFYLFVLFVTTWFL